MVDTVRNVTKTPAVMEDLAVGRGPVLQKRGEGNKIDLHIVVESVEALNDVDTDKYTKARVYSGAAYSDYVYLDTQWQPLVDNATLALKIFQSPTDGGLTEIQTRTVDAGEVYEVRKTSDGEYATIYSNAAGTTEIVQNGTSNVSDNAGVVEFYIGGGEHYIKYNTVNYAFCSNKNEVVYTVSSDDTGSYDVSSSFLNAPVNVSKCLPTGVYRVSQNIVLSGSWLIKSGAKIKPDAGIEVRFDDTARVICEYEHVLDLSEGGESAYEAGAYIEYIKEDGNANSQPIIVRGHPNTTIGINSGGSYVFGGTESFPNSLGSSSQLSWIGGSYDNHIEDNCIASWIGGGAHHYIRASHGSVGGGAYQECNGSYGIAGWGKENIVNSSFSVNVGGQLNEVGDPTAGDTLVHRSSFNGAGTQNKVYALRAFNGSGFLVQVTGDEAVNVGGSGANVSGYRASNLGGLNVNVSGDYATGLGGSNVLASGNYSVAGGTSQASGVYSVSIGDFNLATAPRSVSQGGRSKAYLDGQRSLANGSFSTNGDAQQSEFTMRRQTLTTTTDKLGLFGGNQPAVMPDNTTWIFTIDVVGRAENGDHAVYKFEGVCSRGSGAGTVSFIGTPVKTEVFESNISYNSDVSMNTTVGSLDISITTAATTKMNWVAKVALVEVSI